MLSSFGRIFCKNCVPAYGYSLLRESECTRPAAALCLFLSAVHLSGPILQPATANALFLPLNNRLSSLLASAAPVDVQYKEIEV